MTESETPTVADEAREARLELYMAIKQAAEVVRLDQVGSGGAYKNGHTALLALAQACAALDDTQPR